MKGGRNSDVAEILGRAECPARARCSHRAVWLGQQGVWSPRELRRRGGRRTSMGALKLHPCCVLHLNLGGYTEVLEWPVLYQKGPFVASFRAGKSGRSTLTCSAHSSSSREADGSALCLYKREQF